MIDFYELAAIIDEWSMNSFGRGVCTGCGAMHLRESAVIIFPDHVLIRDGHNETKVMACDPEFFNVLAKHIGGKP